MEMMGIILPTLRKDALSIDGVDPDHAGCMNDPSISVQDPDVDDLGFFIVKEGQVPGFSVIEGWNRCSFEHLVRSVPLDEDPVQEEDQLHKA